MSVAIICLHGPVYLAGSCVARNGVPQEYTYVVKNVCLCGHDHAHMHKHVNQHKQVEQKLDKQIASYIMFLHK